MRLTHWLLAVWERLWPPKSFGRRGEDAAARFLEKLGYIIVARGYRDRIGELDLVAVDKRTLVFVEVKTRSSQEAGHPSSAVDTEKQRRLTRVALAYLRKHELLENPARFDVVAVTWPQSSAQPTIDHFLNAFEPQGVDGFFS